MPTKRNILTVFLASPNDLGPERFAVRDVVQELNESLRDIGWQIELLGWEDTAPGAGRPQELINRDVDGCQLFFGMLWKRWGTPTGKYSSGFEEEFTRVLDRKAATDEPEIMLVFKEIDDSGDPGAQLQLVLDFRRERIDKRDVFFDQFVDEISLKRKLRTWLTRHIYKIDKTSTKVEGIDAKPVPPPPTAVDNEKPDGSRLPSDQVIDAANAIVNFFRDPTSVDADAATRLQLFSMTVTSNQITGETIPAHFANLIFLKRLEYSLAKAEALLLFRTSVESTAENIPGWFWVKEWEKVSLLDYLTSLAAPGNDESLRLRAIAYIGKLGTSSDDTGDFDSIYEATKDESEQIRIAAIDLIGSRGTAEALEIVEALLDDSSSTVRSRAATAKLELLLRHDATRAIALMQTPNFSVQLPADQDIITAVFRDLDDATLFTLLDQPEGNIASTALGELESRNKLTEDRIRPLLEKAEQPVRNRALEFLVPKLSGDGIRQLITELPAPEHWWPYFTLGKGYPEINKTRSRAYARLGSEALQAELDYYSLETTHILRGFGEAYPEIALPVIREMLTDDFESFREKSRKRLTLKYDQATVEALINPDHLFKDDLVEACLAIVGAFGGPDDAQYGRKYIRSNNPGVQLESIFLLSRFGDASDADVLSEALTTGKLETPTAAAKALIDTADNKAETIQSLLTFDDPKVIAFAISSLSAPADKGTEDLLLSLLRDSRDQVRLAALGYFVRTKDDENLTELLTSYTTDNENKGYFYNVVHWLDAVLYSPDQLKSRFRSDIVDRADQEFPRLTNPYH
ncbi:MAG: HEAT repeat domain-containing protein [Pyrinomonadaceae bacterium]